MRHFAVLFLLLLASIPQTGCSDSLENRDRLLGAAVLASAQSTIPYEYRVLMLTGSPSEMGYQQGSRLAEVIVYGINRYIMAEAGIDYPRVVAAMPLVRWEQKHIDEMNGIVQGIIDTLPPERRRIYPPLQPPRDISIIDIMVLNTEADWHGSFGCSSFSVWGAGRSDGSTLIARNLDYTPGPDEALKRCQVVVSRNGPSGKKWVDVGFAGMIGCYSCINEDGVGLFMHSTNGYPTTDSSGYIPRSLTLRSLIETAEGESAVIDVHARLQATPTYSASNFHIVGRNNSNGDDLVAAIMEFDGKSDHSNGRTNLRSPSNNASLPWGSLNGAAYDHRLDFTDGIITTNHYLKRKAVLDYGNSHVRYATIKSMLANARHDGNVTLDEAREIMRGVGSKGTIHTVIFEPNGMRLRIYQSRPGYGAFETEPHDYRFSDLFR